MLLNILSIVQQQGYSANRGSPSASADLNTGDSDLNPGFLNISKFGGFADDNAVRGSNGTF